MIGIAARPIGSEDPPVAAVELARGAHELPEGAAGPQLVEVDGLQRVKPTTSAIRIASADERHDHRGRRLGLRLIKSEAAATAPQKAPVTCGPTTEPPGSRGLVERCSSIQVNGSCHCRLGLRPGRPVVEALLLLAPAAVVAQPGEGPGLGRGFREQDRPRPQLAQRRAGVVAADARSRAAVLDVDGRVVEGRVRAGRRVDDRVRCLPSGPWRRPSSARSPPACWKRMISSRFFAQRLRRAWPLRRRAACPPSRPRAGR